MPVKFLKLPVVLGAVFSFLFFAGFVFAFTGPTQNPGVGGGVLYLGSNGYLGVSTTNPQALLDVNGNISVANNSGYRWGGGTTRIDGNDSSDYLQFIVNNANAIYITQTGTIGIGTTAPSSTLHVVGSTRTTSGFYGNGANLTSLDPANTIGGPFSSANYAFPLSLGVGTSTTANLPETLSVYGDGYFSGSIGIGATSPSYNLDVEGTIHFGQSANGYALLQSGSWGMELGLIDESDNAIAVKYSDTGSYQLGGALGGADGIIVTNSGNVGIATTTPSYKLTVQGPIYSTGSSTASSFCLAGVCQTSWNNVAQWQNGTGGIYYEGKVGVGTQTLSYPLFVSTSSDSLFAVQRAGATYPTIFKQGTDGVLIINNANADILTLSNGKVGIATTTPTHVFEVQSSGSAANLWMDFPSGAGYYPRIGTNFGSGAYMELYNGATGHWSFSNGYGFDFGTGKVTISNMLAVGTTTAPSYAVDINGDINVKNGNYYRINTNAVLTQNGGDTIFGWVGRTDSGYVKNILQGGVELWTNNAARLSIASSGVVTIGGNVGLGTSTPAYGLDVYGTSRFSQPVFVGTPTAAGHAVTKSYVDDNFMTTSTVASQWTTGAGGAIYYSGGSVGIGTSTPGFPLHVIGNAKISGTLTIDSGGILSGNQFTNGGLVKFSINNATPITGANTDYGLLATSGGYVSGASSYTGFLFNFHDVSQGKLVISRSAGTNDATAVLDVKKSDRTTSAFYVTPSGIVYASDNVAIATTTPGYGLTVVGTGSFSQPIFVGTPTAAGHAVTKSYVDDNFMVSSTISSQWTSTSTGIFYSGGKVGIGINSPTYVIDATSATNGGDGMRVVNSSAGASAMGFILAQANSNKSMVVGTFGTGKTGTFFGLTAANLNTIYGNNGVTLIASADSYPLHLGSNNTVALTIATSGSVGIGTTAPRFGTALDIRGWIDASVGIMNTGGQTGMAWTTANQIDFYTAGSVKATILPGGNIGIATTTPSYNLEVIGTGSFSQPIFVGTPTAAGHAVTKSYVDDNFMASTTFGGNTSSTSNFVLKTGDSMSGNLNMGGTNNIIGVNKLTVSTIDPVYNIGGIKYATYVSDSIGIKVQSYGKGKISTGGTYVIDFKNASRGSDEWLFWQTINEGKDMSDVTIVLTPEGSSAELWYELKPRESKIIIHGNKVVKFSYHLVAPRHDTKEWGNLTITEEKGITLPLR